MDDVGHVLSGLIVVLAILRSWCIREFELAAILAPVAAVLLFYGAI